MGILLGGARSANKYLSRPQAPTARQNAPVSPRLSSTASGRHSQKFGCRRAARGDGQGARPERARAGDVVGRVPDHPRALRRKIEVPAALGPPEGVGPELVADLAVVREGPYGEKIPKTVEAELGLGAAAQVSREEPLDDDGMRGRLAEDLGDARQDPRAALPEDPGKGGHVAVDVACDVLRRVLDLVPQEDLPDDPRIRPPREFDSLKGSRDPEDVLQGGLKRLHAGPSRTQDRSVDVPKDEYLLHYSETIAYHWRLIAAGRVTAIFSTRKILP